MADRSHALRGNAACDAPRHDSRSERGASKKATFPRRAWERSPPVDKNPYNCAFVSCLCKDSAMQPANPRKGYILGLSAYVIWGLFPIYFKAIASVPADEIILHRVLWSALFGAVLLMVWKI